MNVWRAWFWRFIFVLTAAVMSIGLYRLSFLAFTDLFSAQLLRNPFELSYPEFSVARSELEPGKQSLLITLNPEGIEESRLPNPEQLFLEFQPEGCCAGPDGKQPVFGSDQNRLNGSPFLQVFVPPGTRGQLRLIHRVAEQSFVVRVQEIDALLHAAADNSENPTRQQEVLSPPQEAQDWQWFAITALMLLGAIYSGIRVALWKANV